MDILTSDTRSLPTPTTVEPATVGDPAWRDRLVELHVLAEHGDPHAADIAERWLATDPAAQHAWSEVERTCHHLRTV